MLASSCCPRTSPAHLQALLARLAEDSEAEVAVVAHEAPVIGAGLHDGAEGLARRGGRRGGVVHNVSGFAIRGSSEVGADPGGQPGARVGAFRKERPIQRAERGVYPVQVAATISRQKAVRDSDLVMLDLLY